MVIMFIILVALNLFLSQWNLVNWARTGSKVSFWFWIVETIGVVVCSVILGGLIL